METTWTALFQLVFVGIVYYAAYRRGFKASQAKAAAIMQQFSRPVDEMIHQLDREIDKALDKRQHHDKSA